jgi:outer membrane protein OmpA-like peptidoglycan-associated protein
MKTTMTLAAMVFGILLTTGAAASPCDVAESGLVMLEYETGVTALSADQKAKLDAFADVAKHRNSVCIRAQVDSQGSDDANRRVSAARGEAVRAYLASKGVRADAMEVRVQAEAVTLFGLLEADSQNDRRVTLTYH